MDNNDFEKAPGSVESKGERQVPPDQDFKERFSEGVPEFAGEQFGVAHEGNEYYGESSLEETEGEKPEDNEGISNAASLINYGLDAVAKEKGVENVVQAIKNFDVTDSANPLRDLYTQLGIDDPTEFEDVNDESEATRTIRAQFINEYNMPRVRERSRENLVKAIADMKELIAEVEGVDPRFEELREGARADQKGYFEYAVKDYGYRGLTELFSVLSEQKTKSEPEEISEESPAPDDEQTKYSVERQITPETIKTEQEKFQKIIS